ncbi:F0F1 ATP synthase subunit B [soil metagenome]
MPQLNIADWPPQLFWLAVTFLALYFIISKMVIPRTGGVIIARRDQIAGDLAVAQKLKNDTDAAIAAYEKALAEARSKAHAIVQETRDRLTAEVDAERHKLDAELGTKIAAAEAQIAETKATALMSVQAVATEVAAEIVQALIGIKADPGEVSRAVAKAQGQ